MKKPKGLDPIQARQEVHADPWRRVGAHDDEEKCGKILLGGAEAVSPSIPRLSKDEAILLAGA